MNSLTAAPAFKLRNPPYPVTGYLGGLRHKSLYVTLTIDLPSPATTWLAQLQTKLALAFAQAPGAAPGQPVYGEESESQHLADCILYWVFQAHFACRLPVYEHGSSRQDKRTPGVHHFLIACVDRAPNAATMALNWVLLVFNAAANDNAKSIDEAIAHLPELVRRMSLLVGLPGNTPPYLQAAWDMQVPMEAVELPIHQLGQGRRGRWVDSTLTDQTPQMAARLARNKVQTASILRRAGMPGPIHELVTDEAQALAAASRLGYPVVVKPADLDRGTAVAAGLETQDEVKVAFAAAAKWSRKVLVEKHFHGRDYRVTVFNGKMIWAVERIPGGVTGDGVQTVQALVKLLNADPRRGKGLHSLMKILELDDEADKMLEREQLTRESIPEIGRFVRLRRASNVAVGGTPVPVLEQVHPDNRDLAIRATAALRLDIGGVDFVIPDIAKSWLETGALICEVNSQPSIGATGLHLYPSIIGQLVEGNGRIPIAVIVGADNPEALAASLSARLAAHGLLTGCAMRDRAMVGQEQIACGTLSHLQSGQAVMADRRIGAMLLFVDALHGVETGLPFARFDVLAIAGTAVSGATSQAPENAPRNVERLRAMLAPACDGVVIQTSAAELVNAVADAMIAAEEKHKNAFR